MNPEIKKPLVDLASLIPSATTEIQIKHPISREPLGIFVTIASKDSEVFQSAQRRRLTKRLDDARNGKENPTPEEIESESMDLLVDCVVNWRNITYKGEELPHSRENTRLVLTELKWFREQVDTAIAERGNFIRS